MLRRRAPDGTPSPWRRWQRAGSDDGGQVLIASALALFFIVMVLALALDVGYWFFDHRTAQNQADGAAHAAALELTPLQHPVGAVPAAAVAIAQDYLARNGADAASSCPTPSTGDVYSGMVFWDRSGDGSYDTVRVCVRRESTVFLSALANVETVRISASADASFRRVPLRYALMAMNRTNCRMLFVGVEVHITGGGGTYTNSSCSQANQGALRVQGTQSKLIGTVHDVVGVAYNGGTLTPAANIGAGSRPDPFRDIAPPPIPATCTSTASLTYNAGSHTMQPGRYCESVSIGSSAVVTLQPGVYIFHKGLSVGGQATLSSNGQEVLLYSTCPTSPCNGASTNPTLTVRFDGGVTTNLDGHSDYANIVVYVDRTASSAEVRLTGGSTHSLSGSVYNVACGTTCSSDGPDFRGYVNLQGGSCGDAALNVSVVAGEINAGGSGCLYMPWDPQIAPSESFPALVD
jgi:hypothetical protein